MQTENSQMGELAMLIFKSALVTMFFCVIMGGIRIYFGTNNFLSDVGGISIFASVFGTLYGIIIALVLLEVWSQFNKTSERINTEALALEKLFGLIVYFRDSSLEKRMKSVIFRYLNIIIKDNFQKLGSGERSSESGKLFREISSVIKDIKFNDDHDSTIFSEVITHYIRLAEIRSERIAQSLVRLPLPLRSFLYISSLLMCLTFVVMPFSNMYYGFITSGTIIFLIVMIIQIINDLDNPFIGFWKVDVEPFVRAKKHIEEDY